MDVRYLIIAGLIFLLGINFTQGIITRLLDNLKFQRISSNAIPSISRLVVLMRLFRWATLLNILFLIYAAVFLPFHSELWYMPVGWLLFSYLLGSRGDAVLTACQNWQTSSTNDKENGTLENDDRNSEQAGGQPALPVTDKQLVAQAKCQHCGQTDFYIERKITLFGKRNVDWGYLLRLFGLLGFSGTIILRLVLSNAKLNVSPLAAVILGFIYIGVALIVTLTIYLSPKKRIYRCKNCTRIFQPGNLTARKAP